MANLLCFISQLPDIPTHSILFETTWPHLTYRKAFTHIRSAFNHQLKKEFKFHCLPIIIPEIPLWAMPKPNINFELTKFPKKTTSASIFRALFHEITIEYQNPTICFTDGSKINNRDFLHHTR